MRRKSHLAMFLVETTCQQSQKNRWEIKQESKVGAAEERLEVTIVSSENLTFKTVTKIIARPNCCEFRANGKRQGLGSRRAGQSSHPIQQLRK